MIYAETEIQLKNGCTAVVRNARPEDAKQTIEYLAHRFGRISVFIA